MTSLKATNLISTISGVVLILLVSVFLLANAPLCAQEKKSGSKQEKQAKEDQSWDELEQWAEQAFIDQKPKEARKLWMKALLTAQDNGEELHAATTLNQLNHLFVQEKEYEKAFLALTQALEIRSRLLGKDNLLTSETMGNLALINHKLGHDLEAEELYKKALEIKDKSLGKHSPQSAITLHNLAELKSKHRQYSEAKELFERVKEIDAREYGDSHVEVVRDLISLGINSFRCHKWQESVDYFKESLGKIDSDGETSAVKAKEKVHIYHYLGLSYARLGSHELAKKYYGLARSTGHELHGKHHPANTIAMLNLANNAEALGEDDEAEKLFLEALAHEKAREKLNRYLLAQCNLQVGRYYHRHDMSDQAERFYRDGLKTYEKLPDNDKRKLYELPAALADLLRQTGKDEDAETISRRFLHIHTPHKNDHFRLE